MVFSAEHRLPLKPAAIFADRSSTRGWHLTARARERSLGSLSGSRAEVKTKSFCSNK